MKSTWTFVAAGVVVGALAGVAVGYWEARPWAAGKSLASSTPAGAPAAPNGESSTNDDETAGAHAVAPETTFHFGNMESGAKQRHTFPLRNTGSGPLTVSYVSHTCKCTEVRWNDKSVEPGAAFVVPPKGEATIMLEWAAKVPPSPFRHGATFTTSDPTMSRIEITVEGQIVDSTTLNPSQLNFGSVHVGKTAKAEMFVMSFLEPEVKILSHEVLDGDLAKRIQVAVEPVPVDQLPDQQAKSGAKITANYDPGGTLGHFAGSLRMETNLKKAPSLEVPIIGLVKGDITIFGDGWNEPNGLLRLPPRPSKTGGSWKVNVTIRGDHADSTQVTVQSVTPPELKASLGERVKVRDGLVQFPLKVEIPPGTRPMVREGEDQGGEGEIVLATTHPDTSTVKMRVHFLVQQ